MVSEKDYLLVVKSCNDAERLGIDIVPLNDRIKYFCNSCIDCAFDDNSGVCLNRMKTDFTDDSLCPEYIQTNL
jgi:hypothetical protein